MEKVIHQMWLQGLRNAPARYNLGRESWHHKNPDYKYLFWDEFRISKLLAQSFPQYTRQWHGLDSVIKKCDAARYFILHEYGGVYADLDTFAYRSIDSLIYNFDLSQFSIVLSEESHDPESWKAHLAKDALEARKINRIVGNAIIIARAKQDFWIEFLEACFILSNQPVLDSFSTWHLSKYIESSNHRHKIAILPARYLLATKFEGRSTYVVHSYDQSWFDYSKSLPWEV